MWMGPRNYERWVPAPKTNADFSSIGAREKDAYLNGGAGLRGSKDGHKEYNFAWSSRRREDLSPVLSIASGDYDEGLGDDLIYFIDPTTYDWNILPKMLASPYKAGLDGVSLTVDASGYPTPPTIVVSPQNARGYPARSAVYTVNNTNRRPDRPLYVPIPPGKTLWLGVHGSATNAGVSVTPFEGDAAFDPVLVDMLSSDTTQRVNTSWKRADGITGVEIRLGLAAGASTGTVTLQGLIAQILDDGVVPFPGDFIPGEGNSGCEFEALPTVSPYLGGKLWGMSARLVEVGSWQ